MRCTLTWTLRIHIRARFLNYLVLTDFPQGTSSDPLSVLQVLASKYIHRNINSKITWPAIYFTSCLRIVCSSSRYRELQTPYRLVQIFNIGSILLIVVKQETHKYTVRWNNFEILSVIMHYWINCSNTNDTYGIRLKIYFNSTSYFLSVGR